MLSGIGVGLFLGQQEVVEGRLRMKGGQMRSVFSLCHVIIGLFSFIGSPFDILHAETCQPFAPGVLPTRPEDVYRKDPFKEGEVQVFDISYMGVFVGWAKLAVEKPVKFKDRWHQVFSGTANTSPSYEALFVARDSLKAYSLPGSFAVSKFKMEQYEHKILSKAFVSSKWIDYDQSECKARELIVLQGENPVRKELHLEPGANDIVSAFYNIRSKSLDVGDVHKILVYTSEKNWFAEASVISHEQVEIKKEVYKAAKIKLKTYLGKELQQRGDLFMWVGLDESRPVVKIEGEIKIGKVKFELTKYEKGSELPPLKEK
jgi:hypothetical protein